MDVNSSSRQTMRQTMLKTFAVLTAVVVVGIGCTAKKKDLISKVDTDAYFTKSDFNHGPYHLSRAIQEADSNSPYFEAIPGMQSDFGLVNVEITETELRFVNAFDPRGRSETAQVLLSFPIKDHFDVIRETNDYGEQTNHTIEDRTKPWNQRGMMRVDWANPSNKLGSILTQAGSYHAEQENTVLLQDPVVDKDGHISFLAESGVKTHKMISMIPPFGEDTVAAYRVTYRTHLTPAPKSDFQPVSYSLKDFGRFGYFVTQQDFEDPQKGFLDSSIKIYANVFNVCEAGRKGSCSTNQIKWVLTKGFPSRYLQSARDSVKQWNQTFQEALGRKDDVVVLDESTQVDLADNRFNTIAYYESKTNGGLLGVAQSVDDPRTGERIAARATIYEDGIRYEQGVIDTMIDLITSDDPLSEVIGTEALGPKSGVLAPFAYDNKSPTATPKAMSPRAEMQMRHNLLGLETPVGAKNTTYRAGLNELNNLGGLRANGNVSVNAGRQIPAFLRGNSNVNATLDTVMKARPDLLHNPEFDMLADLAGETGANKSTTIAERLMKFGDQMRQQRKGRLLQTASGIHSSEFVDDAALRFIAKRLKMVGAQTTLTAAQKSDLRAQKEAIKADLANLIFYTTLVHEMGHTFGLRHNFKGSADRAHYYPRWAALHKQMETDKSITKDDLAPYSYSSIMDYGGDFYSQADGVGPYDKAAIKYAYNRSIDRDNDPVTKEGFFFCTDHQVGEDVLCRQFDRGSTVTEVTENAIDQYHRNWALHHFRRGRLQFEGMASNLDDYYIERTMIPVRQVMDEFFYTLINAQPTVGGTSGCRFQFMEDSIANGDIVNICDPAAAKAAGVDSGDLGTFAKGLYDKNGNYLKDSGELKPYGLGDLVRAGELAQNFFADVLGSIEPGIYLAQTPDASTAAATQSPVVRKLIPLNVDASDTTGTSLTNALKAQASKASVDPDTFVAQNSGNVVQVNVGRYGHPYMFKLQEEGTMRIMLNAGELGDKIAATIALSLRDYGVAKYEDNLMAGDPYEYPQTKKYTTQLFSKMFAGSLATMPMNLTTANGTQVLGVADGMVDFNLQRIGIVMALTQFVVDINPSAVQKMRVCISGESQCGSPTSPQVAVAKSSTNAFAYSAAQTLQGDSLAYNLVANMKTISDSRDAALDKQNNASKTIATDLAKLNSTDDLRKRIADNLDKIATKNPAVSAAMKPLVADIGAGSAPQGFSQVVAAVSKYDTFDVPGFVQAALAGLNGLKQAGAVFSATATKFGVCFKNTAPGQAQPAAAATATNAMPAMPAPAMPAATRAAATNAAAPAPAVDCKSIDPVVGPAVMQLNADFVELIADAQTAAQDALDIKNAPNTISTQTDALSNQELETELIRNLMNVLGWR